MNPDLCVLIDCCGAPLLLCFTVNPNESPEDFARRVVRIVLAAQAACDENCETPSGQAPELQPKEGLSQAHLDAVKAGFGL